MAYDKEKYELNKEKLRARMRKYYSENKERYRQADKKFRDRDPKKYYAIHNKAARKVRLKREYNITPEEYENILQAQQNCCAICKKSQEQFSKKLHIDHCHTTGKVRGLLCNACNLCIGKAEDSITILQNAVDYLKLFI